jgi:hypothetical protein
MALALLFPCGWAQAQDPTKTPTDTEKPKTPRPPGSGPDGQKPPSDSPTFDDLKNSLGDLEQKESKEETQKREATVQKNYDETLKIYNDALGQKDSELHNVNRRIDINKSLTVKYERLLDQAVTGLAATRSQFINRTLSLKKSLDEGKISKEAYDKLVEDDTKRFRNREKELSDDIAFYREEILNSKRATKDLGVKKELMEYDPFGGEEKSAEQAKVPKYTIVQKVKSTLAEVSGYRSRSVVDTLK